MMGDNYDVPSFSLCEENTDVGLTTCDDHSDFCSTEISSIIDPVDMNVSVFTDQGF